MKRMKKIVPFLLCMGLILSSSMTVSAGSIINHLDKSSFASELDNANWHNANGDVYAENGQIIIPKESTEDTRLVWKSPIRDSGIYDLLMTANVKLRFDELPQGEKFALALGLKTVESMHGTSGNVEVVFSNNGGITAAVVVYDENGEEVTIAKEQSIGVSLKRDFAIDCSVRAGGKITVKVAGKTLCTNADMTVNGEGRVGFVQTGSCAVRITDVNFTNYDYDSPENCNIDEDFDDGEFNKNEFTVNLNNAKYYPAGAYITDYEGEKALYFQNGNVCYLSTKYKYSNFEMIFDVLYQKNSPDVDEDGNVIKKKMDNYLIRYGADSSEMNVVRWEAGVFAGQLVIGNSSRVAIGEVVGSSENHAISSSDNSKRGYTLKLAMIDGTLDVWIKWIDEKDYTHLLTDTSANGVTPNGFIQIIGQDGANFIIDNLKITNKDQNQKLMQPEFASNIFRDVPDVEYEQQEIVYMEVNEGEDTTFNWYLISIITFAAGIAAVGVTALILALKRKKYAKKAGDTYDI